MALGQRLWRRWWGSAAPGRAQGGRRCRGRQFEVLEARQVLAPVPVALLDAPANVMIGETANFTVTFDNQATGAPSTGYGPYVDLFVETTGADGVSPGVSEPNDNDGLGNITVSHLGASITPIPVVLGPGGTFTHPIAVTNTGAPLTGTAPAGFTQGDTLYVLVLPFGSFVDAQTPAVLNVSSPLSNEADLNTPVRLAARGGFRYGADPTDNPTVDNPIVGATATDSIAPTLIQLTKTYLGPEDETATGPNFPRQYTVTADIAAGQTITDLRLSDFLPKNMQFLSLVTSSPGGAVIEQTPTLGAPQNAPNNDLVVRFPSVTGGAGTNDASITFEFFVPEFDANNARIINATTGDDVPEVNDSRVSGSWDPVDPNDAVVAVNIVDQATPIDNHTLTEKSIAIQKSVAVLTDTGAPGPSPGDTMIYTLNFQISDYFTFGDLVVEDIFSDGQRLNGSPLGPFPGPFTLTVTDRNGTVSGNFSPNLASGATNLFVDLSEIGNDTNAATDGSTRLVFDVSRALTDLGAADGILQGGRAIAPDAGGATGTITYRTIIQENFSDTYLPNDNVVDQGDQLNNAATITGSVRSNSAIGTPVDTEADDTAASFEIVSGAVLKTVYAINNTLGTNNPGIDPDTGLTIGPSYSSGFQVRPGDVVTYRIRYTLPTGDVEDLQIIDYLPLPVYDASGISTTFNTTVSSAAPASNVAKYGPDHTFSNIGAGVTQHPTVLPDGTANSVTFDFGSYDNPTSGNSMVIDVLVSVPITDAPMADGLFLTNQVTVQHGTTNAGTFSDDEIVQITLTEPVLGIRKGVVSTSNPAGTFSTTVAPTGITFEAPGVSSAGSFSGGTINTGNIGATLNANLANVDAGDLVKFVVLVENTGRSTAGAFDIRLRDTIPAGFAIPTNATGLNLEAVDGTGAAITFSTIGTGFFDLTGGIELDDPGPTPASGSPAVDGGALDVFHATNGRNVAIITYDLVLVDATVAGAKINTASLTNYAGLEGGADHTPADLTDTARVDVTPSAAKTLVSTSIVSANNSNTQAVIGEIATYDVVVTFPEGTMPSTQIVDTLPSGMAFVDVVSVTPSGSFTIQNAIGTGTTPANTTVTNNGQTVTFNLGNIDNSTAVNNGASETLTIRLRAVVLNVAGNQSAPITNLVNAASVTWTGGSINATPPTAVRVIEPLLDVAKSVSSASADAFDTLTYTITVSHAAGSNADAFDVNLSDTLPAGLTYVASTFSNTLGLAPTTISDAGGVLTASWSSFPLGSTSTFQFQATVGASVIAGSSLVNTATGTWTSLSGPTNTDISSYNTNSRERTGAGGVNDYTDNGAATTSINVSTTKSIVASSEASTTNPAVAIGEIVRYHFFATVPEGSAPNFQLVDQLPVGLQYLDDGTARYTFVSNGSGISSSTLGAGTNVVGSSGALTPGFPLAVGVLSGGPFASGTDPTFSFGNLTNSDNDADSEFVIVEFNALVLNVAGNVAGTNLDNTFSVRVNGAQVGPVSSAIRATVAEPSITNVTKTALAPASTGVDAGSVVTYSVTFSNPSGANAATAFETQLTDVLPTGLANLTNVRVFRNAAQILTGFTNNSTAAALDLTIATVAPGDAIEVRYDATVELTVQPGDDLDNNVDVVYSSLPGSAGTAPNPTGSVVPGGSGTGTGERNGSGGVNDYVDSHNETVTVHAHSISGFVYRDNNNNGVFDEAAGQGIINVSVRLQGTDHLNNTIDITIFTDGNGFYQFPDLRPGTYTVTETQPANFVNAQDTLGAPAAGATNANRLDDTLGTFTFAVGAPDVDSINNNFGEIPASTLSGRVFSDLNNSGTLNGPDAGIGGVTIELTGTDIFNNPVTRTIQTNPDGTYAFTNLIGGTYSVREVAQPTGYFDGQDALNNVLIPGSLTTDVIAGITFGLGGNAVNNNFAEVPEVDPVGYVYVDADLSGTRQVGETGIPGVVITLSGIGNDIFGNAIPNRTAFTDANGFYQFANLPPGRYTITETQPVGFLDAQEENGTPPAATVNNDQFVDIDLLNNAFGGDYNFGEIAPTGSVGGSVYVDLNNNGLRDAGEIGLAGVTVTIVDQNNPNNSATVITDANGNYRFVKMFPGTYRVTETHPTNFVDGQDRAGTLGGTVANDVISGIVVPHNGAGTGYNFGELGVLPTLISKRAFLNLTNGNTAFTGPPGSDLAAVSVPLADPAGYVYVDANNNGRRDAGEPGIANVEIRLHGIAFDGRVIEGTLHTDHNGFYQFAFLPPGTYAVYETQPAGYLDGPESLGSHGGVIGPDRFTGIVLHEGDIGVDYNFAEIPAPPPTADLNSDGQVNRHDLALLLLNFGPTPAGTTPSATPADLNNDGRVNLHDLALLQANWTPTSAPSPSAATESTNEAHPTTARRPALRAVRRASSLTGAERRPANLR